MELTKTFAVETSYISICFYCYVIVQQLPSPTHVIALNLYQIIRGQALVQNLLIDLGQLFQGEGGEGGGECSIGGERLPLTHSKCTPVCPSSSTVLNECDVHKLACPVS